MLSFLVPIITNFHQHKLIMDYVEGEFIRYLVVRSGYRILREESKFTRPDKFLRPA